MPTLLRKLTGILGVRCDARLLLGHQCFQFASGACDSCMKPLCSEHKCKRTELKRGRRTEYILCEACSVTYDKEHC